MLLAVFYLAAMLLAQFISGQAAAVIVASLTGWVGIGIAIVFHEGSTIVVVLNALRLLGFKSPPLNALR